MREGKWNKQNQVRGIKSPVNSMKENDMKNYRI